LKRPRRSRCPDHGSGRAPHGHKGIRVQTGGSQSGPARNSQPMSASLTDTGSAHVPIAASPSQRCGGINDLCSKKGTKLSQRQGEILERSLCSSGRGRAADPKSKRAWHGQECGNRPRPAWASAERLPKTAPTKPSGRVRHARASPVTIPRDASRPVFSGTSTRPSLMWAHRNTARADDASAGWAQTSAPAHCCRCGRIKHRLEDLRARRAPCPRL